MTTATPQASTFQEFMRSVKVVDADTHFTEPPDLWTSRAPAHLKELVPQIKTDDQGDAWVVNGDTILARGTAASVIRAGGEKAPGVLGLKFADIDAPAYDPVARLKMMDELGIYAQIVYPNAAGFGSGRFLSVTNSELRNLSVSIYNDAVAEWQAGSNGRLFPQFIIPFWDMQDSLREIRRCVQDLKLTGITATSDPQHYGLPDYGDAYWDPFWDTVTALKIPINFHIASGDMNVGAFLTSPWASLGAGRRMVVGATNQYLDNARVITNMMFSGVLDRYPDLKFVSVESGIGWIPFVLEAAEYQFEEFMTKDEQKEMKLRPTEYFQRNIYACFWFEDFGPRKVIDLVGPKNILFETDYPHPTCLYPRAQEHVADVLQGLDEYTRRRVLQDNAIEVYNLPIQVNA